jgi:hypothetical protein
VNVPVKLGAFALALAVVFGGTYAAGAIAGPVASEASETSGEPGGTGEAMDHGAAEEGGATAEDGAHGATGDGGDDHGAEAAASGPGGLAVSAEGYTLRRLSGDPVAGRPGEFAFQIVDGEGAPVTGFQVSHDKRLHLIVARRDLTGFAHLHPVMAPDGTWRTPLRLAEAGQWRVFADFLPEGRDQQVILGVDVPVAGDYRPRPLPAPAVTAVVDGYRVDVRGDLVAGRISRLTLSVSRDGAPVTDLEPYLGAYGHLVALRAGDLGYLHVHPLDSVGAGPEIAFDVEVPTAGAYRMFLDFQHGGTVRTAAFTATAA